MWLLVVGSIVLVIVTVWIRETLGYKMTTKPGLSMQETNRERDELVNRWFSGKHQPEGDIDDPMWD